jgi:hypothetical protein
MVDPIPADDELIERGLALQKVLAGMSPSEDFTAGAVESLTDALVQIVAELRGERPHHITRFRPDGLTSYLKNNYEGTLATQEGRDVYSFIRTLAFRAEALDLPPIVPVNKE